MSRPDRESAIEEAIEAIRAGSLVIVVDSHERENEGDFICAAESMTPELVDFMLKFGRGLLCTPLTAETADRLHLAPMVQEEQNTAPHRTPFLVPVDHESAGTGVSPDARAATVRALADPKSSPGEFVRPGHISPLLAKDGGVLRRAGHTEATVDLCRLAGKNPVGVLIEICSRDGRGMAGYDELCEIADEYNIPIVSIENLIRYRRQREQLVHRVAEVEIPTKDYGTPTVVGYKVDHEVQEPLALVWGNLTGSGKPPLVRMHSSCFTGDLLASLRCDCGDQLHMAMRMIADDGCGAVVYLPQEGRGIGLMPKLKAYVLQDQGMDTVEANTHLGFKADQRDYMVGLQILKDLGLREIRLLTNNPKKTDSFVKSAMDLDVVEQVPIIAPPEKTRERYMQTKRDRMGHLLPGDEATS
ncbi:GTP cyclohydrolase II [Stratiformator vulcanicus]|uniref:GTP cyclohydrolase-2 n=1 Tax=Stratiformator vulcanicus TaxID=2527980 RepID=A0A517R372_9PLAN|nr:GTP cyclohydrolase II [Stratiformator vulcanicus]QDT38332.1 Riboflavin biosynthesis protein RibBA [Stratiformator vulcanicus]